jgi:hypothetical protein
MMSGNVIRKSIPVVLFLCALAYWVFRCMGCKPAADPSALPRFCTSEELYTAELVRCVDRAETLAQSQQCRSAVDYRCGIVQTVKR